MMQRWNRVLLREMRLTIALLVLASGCKEKTREQKMFGESHVDKAKLTVQKYAFEAYPQWARANPNAKCPAAIADLAEYMDTNSTRDPWGSEFVLECTDGKVRVHSFGEDGKDGTGDDIRSWE